MNTPCVLLFQEINAFKPTSGFGCCPFRGGGSVVVAIDSFLIMLLPLWDSVIVLCFVVRYFVSILVLQSS